MSRWSAVSLTLIALSGVWHLTTLRPGHGWGDDFALYLGHARNLAEGTPYARTGYVYNPAYASLSPRTYPPVLPLLAAPVYRVFGLDVTAYKVLLVVLFLLFLLVTFAASGRELPPACVAGVVLLLGAHPFFWDYKDRILSEIPFLLFSATALALLGRLREGGLTPGARLALSALAGASVYLACGTRTVGIVLVPCVLLQDCFRTASGPALFRPSAWRVPGFVSGVVLGTFFLGVAAQKLLLVVEGSYLDQLVFDLHLFLRNFVSLVKAMALFFDNGHSDALRRVLFAACSALALVGYLSRVWRGPTAREFFAPAYFAIIVIWPCSEWNPRFLLPLLPLTFVYACHGLVALHAGLPRVRPATWPAGIALALLLLASYAGQYGQQSFGPLPGIARPEARELFAFVRDRTPPDAVLLFQRPRALALFTRRQASAHQTPVTDPELWQLLGRTGASFLVVGGPWAESRHALEGFVERNAGRLEPVFGNAEFKVYRICDSGQALAVR